MPNRRNLVPAASIENKIMLIRGQKVMLDSGLAVKPGESMEKATLVFPPAWIGLTPKQAADLPRQAALMEDEAARFDLLCWQMAAEAERKGPFYEEMIRTKCLEFYYLVQRRAGRPELKPAASPIVETL